MKKTKPKKGRQQVLQDIVNCVNPKTEGQQQYIDSIEDNQVCLCDGPAGTGKTFISFGMALNYYATEDYISRIVIVRPTIPAGDDQELGYLPGDLRDKMGPFIAPLVRDSAPALMKTDKLRRLAPGWSGGDMTHLIFHAFDIEIVPLAYMRGRTFHNSFVILDEAQNCTMRDFKLFLTRIGRNSKVVIEGDSSQKDRAGGSLDILIDKLEGVNEIGVVRLKERDIIRNPLIADILKRLD